MTLAHMYMYNSFSLPFSCPDNRGTRIF